MQLKDINETFAEDMADPEYVAGYLEAVLEEGDTETFLIALRNVAKANGGMTQLARATSLGRESLYKALSEQGNPEFKTLQAILGALGLRFSVTRAEPPAALPA
ncbi:MAG: putative addiction module antidote protein [Armatimonadetes bacterium]|nr:putative addiction module antidote protein [Armatimonadota bacterium]